MRSMSVRMMVMIATLRITGEIRGRCQCDDDDNIDTFDSDNGCVDDGGCGNAELNLLIVMTTTAETTLKTR